MEVPPSPAVPGFTLHTLVRFSRTAEWWQASDQASGESRALVLVDGALPSRVTPLSRVRDDHLLPLLSTVEAGPLLALVFPLPPERTLASLRAQRPRLDAGEVAFLGSALAGALAAAHERGIVHGDLDPSDVAIDDVGRPVLLGLGIAELAGHVASPEDDVLALALVLRALLGDSPDAAARSVSEVLAPALSGQPGARPAAHDLARALAAACPQQPLRWTQVGPAGQVGRAGPGARVDPVRAAAPVPVGRHALARPAGAVGAAAAVLSRLRSRVPPSVMSWRPSRTALVAVLAVSGLGLLLLAAPQLHRSATPDRALARRTAPPADARPSATTAAPASAPASAPANAPAVAPAVASASAAASRAAASPATPNWAAVAAALARSRDAAFTSGNPALLDRADAPKSTAHAIDDARLSQLTAARVLPKGLASRVDAVAVEKPGGQVVTLRLVEQVGAYDLVTADGTPVHHVPATVPTRYRVTLVRTAAGWRAATAARE